MRYVTIGLCLIVALTVSCTKKNGDTSFTKLNADSLIVNIEDYNHTLVEVEGLVVHICGVDGKKMKIKTAGGASIKVVYADSLQKFDTALYNKQVRIYGKVVETRLTKPFVDKMEQAKAIPCSIDSAPCIDSLWIKGKREAGKADSISRVTIDKLRKRMEQSTKPYTSVVTIRAEKVALSED